MPFHYAYPVDHLIRALKFHGERAHARVLGTLLARLQALRSMPRPELIVPIPLHPSAIGSEVSTRPTSWRASQPRSLVSAVDAGCIWSGKYTRSNRAVYRQQRRRNVRGAFEVVRAAQRRMRVALIDDVLTTGSTALAAAQALVDAGVSEVELWAVARVALN